MLGSTTRPWMSSHWCYLTMLQSLEEADIARRRQSVQLPGISKSDLCLIQPSQYGKFPDPGQSVDSPMLRARWKVEQALSKADMRKFSPKMPYCWTRHKIWTSAASTSCPPARRGALCPARTHYPGIIKVSSTAYANPIIRMSWTDGMHCTRRYSDESPWHVGAERRCAETVHIRLGGACTQSLIYAATEARQDPTGLYHHLSRTQVEFVVAAGIPCSPLLDRVVACQDSSQ